MTAIATKFYSYLFLLHGQGGKTALWYAVEKNHTAVVKELLEFGAFTESRRKVGLPFSECFVFFSVIALTFLVRRL